MQQNKICSKCKIDKPLVDFNNQKRGKYRKMSMCRVCSNKISLEHYRNNKNLYARRQKEWYNKNPEKKKEQDKQSRLRRLDKIRKTKQKYYKNNKEKLLKKSREYYRNNAEIYKEQSRKWKKANPEYRRYEASMRRATKIQATLLGYNREIKEIYSKCPKNYHVDHIIPLRGKGVCGLHVPWNLQYLTPEENLKKGIKY